MPRRKRSTSPFQIFDDEFDDDSQSSRNGNPPVQRNAANARERARMRVLSSAFGRLKTKLPNIPPDTKLSKLDTLRLATAYIKQLKSLADDNALNPMQFSDHGSVFDMTNGLSWPFGLHHIQSPTNRQQLSTFQCSPMEWNQTTTTATTTHTQTHTPNTSRCTPLNTESLYTPQHTTQSTMTDSPPWYLTQNSNVLASAHGFNNNFNNICSNSGNNSISQMSQHQNSQFMRTFPLNSGHHHLQSTMSPIR